MVNDYLLGVLIALGFFLGGLTAAYNLHPDASRLAWVMGGLASLAPYLVGLASKAPWEKK